MADLESLLSAAVRRPGAEYVEVRVDDSRVTRLDFRGPRLDVVSESAEFGVAIRALVNGAWGFVSTTSLDDLDRQVDLAISQAASLSRRLTDHTSLAPVEPVRAVVPRQPGEDPRSVSLAAKRDLMAGYNQQVLDHKPEVTSSQVRYFDRTGTLTLATSAGTYIQQERVDLGGSMTAIATRNGDTQMRSVGFGSSADFAAARGHEAEVEKACAVAASLLDAPIIAGGEYTVVLDPWLAGVFIHEAFGHLSEADFVYENPALRDIMRLGARFGEPILTVYDSGRDPGARGHLAYDDEGVPTGRQDLIRDGVLVGRLHSRETAAKLGERPTGNARALDYRFPPIVRMRNTCIAPGDASFADMLHGVEDGLYCVGSFGGETGGEMFTFVAAEAYRIRHGAVAGLVRNATLTGNVFTTLKNIDLVGSDFTVFDSAGGCGKGGQMPLPVSHFAPHVRISKAVIGGHGSRGDD